MKWLEIIKLVLPIVIGTANPALAPLAGLIVHGIGTAEGMKNHSSGEKLAAVVDLAVTGAQGLNAATGKTLVDPAMVQQSAAAVISASVDIANLLHNLPPASQTTLPPVSNQP